MGNVIGDSSDVNVAGVFGNNTAGGDGIFGSGTSGVGVTGESDSASGIIGRSNSSDAIFGETKANGSKSGVVGSNPVGNGAGVAGLSTDGNGVFGISQNKHGVFGNSKNWEGIHGETASAVAAGVAGIQLNAVGTGAGVYGENHGKGHGVFAKSQGWEGVHGETSSDVAAGVAGIQLNPNGTGAGVYGESRGKGPAGFFKGNVVVTGDIFLSNADCAEDFTIAEATLVEPGTVMVIDQEGALRQSRDAYDRKVAGVISGAGDYKPGLTLDKQPSQGNRLPVALMGKTFCKVDAQYGAVQVGDLLTTSPTPGHAMKAVDPAQAFGSVIGKALRPLDAGQGLVPILIALQ